MGGLTRSGYARRRAMRARTTTIEPHRIRRPLLIKKCRLQDGFSLPVGTDLVRQERKEKNQKVRRQFEGFLEFGGTWLQRGRFSRIPIRRSVGRQSDRGVLPACETCLISPGQFDEPFYIVRTFRTMVVKGKEAFDCFFGS